MIVLDVEQGSEAWANARLCIPTASNFGMVISPKKLNYSASAAKYRARLLAQWVCGYPLEGFTPTGAMLRGTDLEAEARAWFEMQRDAEVVPVGFVMRDDGSSGGSPDGLVGEDGGVEIKVPLMTTHLEYLLADELPAEHIAQVQGYMYLTGRQWWDFVSYAPGLPCVLKRIDRDDKFIVMLHRHLCTFREELLAGKRALVAKGFVPRPGTEPPEDVSIANEEVVEAMYGAGAAS